MKFCAVFNHDRGEYSVFPESIVSESRATDVIGKTKRRQKEAGKEGNITYIFIDAIDVADAIQKSKAINEKHHLHYVKDALRPD